jgi:hypothetical protein
MKPTHLESSKMNDIVNVCIFCKDLVQSGFVCNVGAVQSRTGAGQQLNPVDYLVVRVVQVVDDDDLVSRLDESESGERANIAHTTAMQSEHVHCVVSGGSSPAVLFDLTRLQEQIRQPFL